MVKKSSKRPLKPRKPLLTGPLDRGAMVKLTRSALRKKNAIGYGKKTRMEWGKDWTHKNVRGILEYMYDRKLFSNKLDTRERTIRFFYKAGDIELDRGRRELQEFVEDYLYQLFERHKIKPENVAAKKELIANFKTTMQLIQQRQELITNEVRKIKQTNPKKKKGMYNTINARDAFAHIAESPISYVIEDILEAAQDVEKRILSKK